MATNTGATEPRMPPRGILLILSFLIAAAAGLSSAGAAERERRTVSSRPAAAIKGITPRLIGGRGASGPATDCNSNGIPDEQDLDDCPGLPACDDCNLNHLPDECDISSGLSLDVDGNGVPDECVFFDGGGGDDYWGTPENWDDDEVPNNLDLIDDESVTIDAATVDLDLIVEVDTLRVLDGASFLVAGSVDEDFDVEEQGGVRIFSGTGIQSVVTLGNTRQLSVPQGTIEIESGGVLEGLNGSGQTSGTAAGQLVPSASIEAGSIRISSRCGEPTPGEMTLSATMDANVYGDVIVDASQDCVVCGFCAGAAAGAGTVAGGETPPILRIKDASKLTVMGDLVLLGGVQFVHTSSEPIYVGGSFVNASTCPECFTLDGHIVFAPLTKVAATGLPQTIELASLDYGPTQAGFTSNFAIGTLEVAAGSIAEFADTIPNQSGQGDEVAYIGTLILRSGSTVTIVDRTVYYNRLIDEGANVILSGGAALRSAGAPTIPAASTWSVVALALSLLAIGTAILRESKAS